MSNIQPTARFPRAPLAAFWLAWAVLLPCNVVYWGLTGQTRFNWWWFVTSIILSMVAWQVWAWTRGLAAGVAADAEEKSRNLLSLSRFAALIALGMTLGALPDIYGVTPKTARPFGIDSLKVSLSLFGLGHIAYIVGSLYMGRLLGLFKQPKSKPTMAGWLAFWLLAGVVLWYTLASTNHVALGCLVYTILLATTTGVMTGLAALDRRFCPMAIGAVLFLASDGFLAVRLFHNNAYNIGDACWITYGIGEMLIVFGAVWVVEKAVGEELKS
ncbi:MAG: lysoplasmalogenase family protein [Planctomycetota bacterium]|nr:lysoplasmalogenase family protein [Planctomycetota bacterium]